MNDPIRLKLRELLADHGVAVCDEPRRCEGLLRDYCAADRRKMKLLVHALKERVPTELLDDRRRAPPPVLVARLAQRLQNDLSLTDDGARWAVESWALALGIIAEADLPPKPAIPPVSLAVPVSSVPASKRPSTVPPVAPAPVLAPPPKPPPARLRSRLWINVALGAGTLLVAGYMLSTKLAATKLVPGLQPTVTTRAQAPQVTVRQGAPGRQVSLRDAIAKAQPGSRVRIAPGVYPGGLVLDKPLELYADGAPGTVTLVSSGEDCLQILSDGVIVRGLTLKAEAQTAGGKFFAVHIAGGRPILESCDISSGALAAVGIHGENVNPTLRRCTIHDGKAAGVFCYDGATGTLDDCEIFGNATAGVAITRGANPTLRGCRIRDGMSAGVFVYADGKGLIENCNISGHAFAQVEIKQTGDPTLRGTKIRDGKAGGVFVYENGRGTLEDCDIVGNALDGVEIKQGGAPTLRRCRIQRNGGAAVDAHDGADGSIEHCDLRGSRRAWTIEPGSNLRRYLNVEDPP